jgi:O-antigen/teichoic acid export membrane protein
LSDRYILQAYTDAATVGVYALGYTGGLLINALVVQPFALAWAAASWEMAKEDDAPRQFADVLTGFAAVGALVALGLSAVATDAFRILVGPDFEASRYVVPFSAFAYVLYGIYSITAVGLDLRSQTRWLPVAVGSAAVVAVILNIILIPLVGFIGAAIATLVSYAFLALLSASLAQRYYPVPWDVPRVIGVMVIGLGLSAAALLGPDHAGWRLLCVAVYPALLVLFRITPPGVLRTAWDLVRRRGSANPPTP